MNIIIYDGDAAAADWDIDPTPPAYPEWSIGNEAFRFIAYPRRRETRHSRPAGGVRPAKRGWNDKRNF